MTDERLQCKGCGEINSIVEVSLVPRIFYVEPDGSCLNGPEEAFWEAETTLGYGCTNDKCEFWHGVLGVDAPSSFGVRPVIFSKAQQIEDIAEVIDD
jgi:hypothetical protein